MSSSLKKLVVLAPTGLRRAIRSVRLRRRHGLIALGHDFDYQISDDCTFGRNCRLGGPAYISDATIGDYSYVEVGARISGTDIGRFCAIAPYAVIGPPEHPSSRFVSTHPAFYRHAPRYRYDFVTRDRYRDMQRTSIGHDVWIGANSFVRSGVTVGNGAVIGAGAVVTKDVPDYAVYGGVPARLLRYRYDRDTIEFLLDLQWWNRGTGWIRRHAALFDDVDHLRARLREADRVVDQHVR